MAHSLGQHRYEISFVPREAQNHTISIKFNRESVPGSPFACYISSGATQASASGPGLERVAVDKKTQFTVTSTEMQPGEAAVVEIVDPQGKNVDAHVTMTSKGNYNIEYTPTVVGKC